MKYVFFLIICLTGFQLGFAGNCGKGNVTVSDSTHTGKGFYYSTCDTLKVFSFGRYQITTTANYEKGSYSIQKRTTPGFEPHWAGFDFGFNGYGSNKFSSEIADADSYMEINGNRSFSFAWNVTDIGLTLVKNRLGLVSGIGIKWNTFAFSSSNLKIDKGLGHLTFEYDTTVSYKKSKLYTVNLVVPLMMELNIPVKNDQLFILAGVEGNFRIGSKTKMVTSNGKKYKDRNDLYLTPFNCLATVRAGYENLGIFLSSSLTPMFKDGKGPELYTYTAGVSFLF